MTAGAQVWVLTGVGAMVRSDRILGLRLRRGSGDDPSTPEEPADRSVLDAGVWAWLEPDWRLAQLEVVEASQAVSALAGLIAVLGQAETDQRASLYVRYERPGWPEDPDSRDLSQTGRWVLTDQPPSQEWNVDLVGLPKPARVDDQSWGATSGWFDDAFARPEEHDDRT